MIQVTDEGLLATGYYTTREEYEHTEYRTVTKQIGLARADYTPTRTTAVPIKTETRTRTLRHDLPKRISLVSSLSDLVDDDWFDCTIYRCGRHQYTTVMGAGATVERYATPEKAMELLGTGE